MKGTRSSSSHAVVGLVAALAIGCDSPAGPAPLPVVTSVEVDSASGPIFRSLVIRLDRAGSVRVDYLTSGGAALRVESTEADTLHEVFLPRLRSERTYAYEVRATEGDRLGATTTGQLTTRALPDSLAGMTFEVTGTPTLPIILFEVWFSDSNWRGLLGVDEAGEIVWYWPSTKNLGGVRRRANGNWVILDGDYIVEVTPDRRVLRTLPAAGPYGEIHHDLEVTPDGTVLFLARDVQPVGGTPIVGEAIWEWIPEAGAAVKRWSSWDHFVWPADSGSGSAPANWFHANSLSLGERGNVVVSARNMDEVFSIAPDFGSIEWRIGGPNPTLALPEEALFWSQHSAIDAGNDRVMLFDNGLGRPVGTYSRVLALQLDVAGGTAAQTGEFRPVPDNFAIRVGSVRRLANGHTVAAFGWGDPDPVEVFELDGALQPVWHMVAGPAVQRAYRGTPWPDIGGEVEVP